MLKPQQKSLWIKKTTSISFMVSCKIMKSKNQFWHILKTCSCGSPWSSSSCGWLRSGCTHKRCHQGWYMVFIFHSNQNSKIISFIFQTSPVSEVLETIQPPLHRAYHSGPSLKMIFSNFFQTTSRRPKINLDPFSTRRLRELDASFQEVQVISEGMFFWQKTFWSENVFPLEFLCSGSFEPQ